MTTESVQVIEFGNETRQDKKLLQQFVNFHWKHYKHDPQYIPLLKYEYLGFKLIGMTGFFEPRNLFFKHAKMRWFLAKKGGEVAGRLNAFVNTNHNSYWNDNVGFFGQFECIDDQAVADALLNAVARWLKEQGCDQIRGPQNQPINEATPGCMVKGFHSRPVIYYHYNKPYYQNLLENFGMHGIKNILSWEVPVKKEMNEKITRIAEKVVKRYNITFENWDDRPLAERKREMFDIYNDAWGDNFGFVPFTWEEFNAIVDDMLLVMEKKLFLFVYVDGEAAAFFGGVLNIAERLRPFKICPRCDLLRAMKMVLTAKWSKGFRTGYLGVKKKFRRLGLDGVMILKQKQYTIPAGYEYSDLGWVLEDNTLTIKLIVEGMGAQESKIYTIYQKELRR